MTARLHDDLKMRAVPPTPAGLSDRIIAAIHHCHREPDTFFMMFLLPRPALLMGLLFILSLGMSLGFDLGFNVPENAYMSTRDILLSFSEETL